MAQTKRKRRTKHRGNAAGIVESRGRTSRPPDPKLRKKTDRTATRAKARERWDQPPEWSSAFTRGGIAAAVFFALCLLILDRSIAQSAVIAAFMLLIYIPMAYMTDSFVYKQRRKGRFGGTKVE